MWNARFRLQLSAIPRQLCTNSIQRSKGGRHKAVAFLILWVLSTVFVAPAQTGAAYAQPGASPLILNIRGDLWAWAGPGAKLQQRTNWGYNRMPMLSPDGKQVAYKSTAQVVVDAIKRVGGMGGGDLPANIWVLDVATNGAVRVADQPADASFQTQGRPDKYIVRSDPTWAGAGALVAWTELLQDNAVQPDDSYALLIYNLVQKSALSIKLNLPAQYGVPAAPQIVGSSAYLAVRSTIIASDANGQASSEESLLIFDTAGALVSTAKIGLLTEFTWAKYHGKDYVAAVTTGAPKAPLDAHWILIEPQSGQISEMPGKPEMYNPAVPGSVSLLPKSLGTSPDWQVIAPGKPLASLGTIDDVYAISSVLAISPDGQQFAYVKQGAAFIYNDGRPINVGTTDVRALAWGPVAWRVREIME